MDTNTIIAREDTLGDERDTDLVELGTVSDDTNGVGWGAFSDPGGLTRPFP